MKVQLCDSGIRIVRFAGEKSDEATPRLEVRCGDHVMTVVSPSKEDAAKAWEQVCQWVQDNATKLGI